jgi:L,D-transpeptidase ErfK/SrfK
MRKKLHLVLVTSLILAFPSKGAASEEPILYHLVSGGPAEFTTEKRQDLNFLALSLGIRPWVLAWQNKLKLNATLPPGSKLVIDTSHIVPTELSHGLVINLPELLLYQFHQGVYQRRYALAVGKKSWPTPTGDYYIRNKAENPTWTVPASIQAEMEELGQEVVEKVPPGPKNPLGKYWLGTSAPGVGIHATNRPWSVGHFVSHGCIRMLPGEIAQLYQQVEVGTPVRIIYRPVKMALTPQKRLFLEAHPNIYGKKIDYLAVVETLVKTHNLETRINWPKVIQTLKIKSGVAQDVTRDPEPTKAAATPANLAPPRELGLFPLQVQDTKIE